MPKESQERRQVKETLRRQGDRTLFQESLYLKINRMLADLNRVSRIQGLIGQHEVLYSIQKEGAPQGMFYVVRNAVQSGNASRSATDLSMAENNEISIINL